MSALLRRHRMMWLAFAGSLVAVLLYWPSFTLPVIYDDLLHIRIADGLNLATVWLPTDEFGFYRPLTFLPLLLIRYIFGRHPAWMLHGLNVCQHGFNVFLLIMLSWRLWRLQARALVGGLLFALFPFSYQAIAVYGHNVHPTTTGLILLGLHAYLTAVRAKGNTPRGRIDRNNRRFWWGVTGLIFLLSVLSHESSILFGAFAAFVHWNDQGTLPASRRLTAALRKPQPWLIFLVLGAIYAFSYQFLPINVGPQGVNGAGGSLWLRVLYLIQAVAYPLAWFAHLLPNIGASTLVLIGFGITALLTIWAARHPGCRLPLLLGWGWWGLSSLLLVLSLPTSYLLHGPRLLYLSSVGIALIWTFSLPALQPGFIQKAWLAITAGFILVTSAQFVRGRLRDYGRLTEPVDMITRVMASHPRDEGVVIVNLPQWLSPPRNTFAVGAELVAMLGNYLFDEEIIAENTAGNHAVYSVVVTDLLDSTPYPYSVHDETAFRRDAADTLPIPGDWDRNGSQVFVVQYEESGPQTTHVGAFQPEIVTSSVATLGPYRLNTVEGDYCGGQVQLTLALVTNGHEPISPTISISAQALAEDGQLIAQQDRPPLQLRPDFVRLETGWQIIDHRTLTPSQGNRPSQLLVGVYDFVTGDRLVALDSKDIPLPDNVLPVPVATCP